MPLELRELHEEECFVILEESRFGHLGCCKDSQPYVVPIFFSYEKGIAYAFSMPGRKLDWMRENDKVCLQVDQKLGEKGWRSVVLEGRYVEFPDTAVWNGERLHAWSLLQKHSDWWEIGSLKPHEITVQAVSLHVFFGIFLRNVNGRIATSKER
ncbi:pyridoxamine 5'-phosphate oxidase family protein [Rhizobium sp. RAF56]|uniref:pyridoxamine 5'-phosphate oxidase family protein n=1 Tax=Rhizobium sp. RAF56 TaxID=3233062 RepID=UPI003F9D8DE7